MTMYNQQRFRSARKMPRMIWACISGICSNIISHIRCLCVFLGQVDASRVAYRPRESPYPMITVDQAIAIVMEHAQPLPEETIKFTGKNLEGLIHFQGGREVTLSKLFCLPSEKRKKFAPTG